jgi:hypothetical protein
MASHPVQQKAGGRSPTYATRILPPAQRIYAATDGGGWEKVVITRECG